MKYVNELLSFIKNSPTSFQAVDNIVARLESEGYINYNESSNTKLEKGNKYYVTRNQSSVIAFNIGSNLNNPSFNVVASHTDCPTYKVKPNAIIKSNGYIKLNTEGYGGMIRSTWLDRPLSLAGRVICKKDHEIKSITLDIKEKILMIPSLAIHLAKDFKDSSLNQQIDMLPIIAQKDDFDFKAYLANKLNVNKEDVITFDLYLYPVEDGFVYDKFISSHHLDNLECAYTSLEAFINNFNDNTVNVYVSFDNEEVGSRTRQGAGSKFLFDILDKLANDLGFNLNSALASTLLVSADNAHAIHPNHPEKSDSTNHTKMNDGIVIKYNANQSYTSDALSVALFLDMIKESGVKHQFYTNRSDLTGGGTLGYVSSSQVSVMSVDIGLAQLAMHSTMETAGVDDVEMMIEGLKAYYKSHLVKVDEVNYKINK